MKTLVTTFQGCEKHVLDEKLQSFFKNFEGTVKNDYVTKQSLLTMPQIFQLILVLVEPGWVSAGKLDNRCLKEQNQN